MQVGEAWVIFLCGTVVTTNGIILVPMFKEVFDKLERGAKGMAKGLKNTMRIRKQLWEAQEAQTV